MTATKRASLHFDKINNHLQLFNSYDVKEEAKALGFKYNGINRYWYIKVPNDALTYHNLLADIFVDCKLDYDKFMNFVEYHAEGFYPDEAHIAKANAYIEENF